MNWEDLRHFLALAEAGSLSEAARRLGVDHTTVARRVGMLEGALGLRLVDRLPRAVTLTAEGRQIAALGERLAEDVFAILRAARGADPEVTGLVQVSAPPTFASTVVAPRIRALKNRYPRVVLDLVGERRAVDLGRREADIALRLSRPVGDGLVARKIGEITFGLFAATGYADEYAPADWEFLAHDDAPMEVAQQGWLKTVAGGRPMAFHANDAVSLAAAARAGMGIAALPLFLGLGDPALVALPCGVPAPCLDVWMVVHNDLRRAPRIRAVMDFLVECVAESEALKPAAPS